MKKNDRKVEINRKNSIFAHWNMKLGTTEWILRLFS